MHTEKTLQKNILEQMIQKNWKLCSDWEAFIEKGKKYWKERMESLYVPGIADAQQFIREQGAVSWIDGDTINATKSLQRSMDLACKFRDAGIVDKLEAWSAPGMLLSERIHISLQDVQHGLYHLRLNQMIQKVRAQSLGINERTRRKHKLGRNDNGNYKNMQR